MSVLLNALKDNTNFTRTENGALTHKTTKSDLLDMFAMGGAYRKRSDEDVILLFKKAYEENPVYALKCLFYLRDIRGGQGERRFFRVCIKWLANNDIDAMRRNLQYVPMFGRYDDLYEFVGTKLEKDAFQMMKRQLALDMECKTPSLLAKWLKSENTSSQVSRDLGNKTRMAFGMTHKQYRKTLSILRERINVLERLMSAGKWDEIEFDKIPSRAGMIYKNAFARHDLERMRQDPTVQSYADFAKDETKAVNAKALYPYECVHEAVKMLNRSWNYGSGYKTTMPAMDNTNRLMVNKYWDNLADYFNGASFNGLAVVDTSGSMCGAQASAPINVAISLGLYCAEKANGPFKGHYISFSSRPQLIATEGVDFVDKVARIWETNLCENTNIEATFDLILNTALAGHMTQADLPENIIILSDMEFDAARGRHSWYGYKNNDDIEQNTLMENISNKWEANGYHCPNLIFWNVDARHNNIPMKVQNGITFVSGFSPTLFEQIMSGKTAIDLMYEVLNQDRYSCIK